MFTLLNLIELLCKKCRNISNRYLNKNLILHYFFVARIAINARYKSLNIKYVFLKTSESAMLD